MLDRRRIGILMAIALVVSACEGPRLEPVVHGDHFWFAWAAFAPETEIWRPAP